MRFPFPAPPFPFPAPPPESCPWETIHCNKCWKLLKHKKRIGYNDIFKCPSCGHEIVVTWD